MIRPRWKLFTFLAQCAEQVAEPGRASWIPLEFESGSGFQMPAYGQKLLRDLHRDAHLAEILAHGGHIELNDSVDGTGNPLFAFPLRTESRLIALLAIEFPPRLRPTEEALARLRRLFDAAKPLLAALAEEDSRGRQFEGLAQVHSHVMRNAVHDLRTPLMAIHGYARLLLREHAGPLTGEQREYAASMLANTERMVCELNSLSELGRTGPVRLTAFDLCSFWSGVAEKIHARAGEKAVRIQARFSRRPFPITADAVVLAQALGDLSRYVIQRTADGGLVQVGFDQAEDIVVRIATDDGHHSASDGFEALTAARWAVRRHGGQISVSAGAGQGLTVIVTLPVIEWTQPGAPEDANEQAFDSCRG